MDDIGIGDYIEIDPHTRHYRKISPPKVTTKKKKTSEKKLSYYQKLKIEKESIKSDYYKKLKI